jgi:hypothetical protein
MVGYLIGFVMSLFEITFVVLFVINAGIVKPPITPNSPNRKDKAREKGTKTDSVKSFRRAFQPMRYSGGQRSFMKCNQQNNNGETAERSPAIVIPAENEAGIVKPPNTPNTPKRKKEKRK